MSKSHCEREIRELNAQLHGYELNNNDGMYTRGSYYNHQKKSSVGVEYEVMKATSASGVVNISELARKCKVGWTFAKKVADEMETEGAVVDPAESYKGRTIQRGPGSKSLDSRDCFILMYLYLEEPSRTLSDYAHWLCYYTGTLVDRSTISRWFLDAFPISGRLCSVDKVPIDKFRPDNILRAYEYVSIIVHIAPERLVYGDEKLLKGQELFNRKTRRNVITGVAPPNYVDSDFRNTYSITGFCSVNPNKTPVCFEIHDGTNDSEDFESTLFDAIHKQFIGAGDVLVLDNAAIHVGGNNSDLQDYLWRSQGVLLLLLPARAPEWNPIELVWNTLVQRLKRIPLSILRGINRHAAAVAAKEVLSGISHEDVWGFYRHCERHKGIKL